MAIPISHIDIDCKASPLPNDQPRWCETFLYFCLPLQTLIIILFAIQSAKSMAHAHVLSEVENAESAWKSMIQLLGLTPGCSWFILYARKTKRAKLYDFVGIAFFSIVYFEGHDCLLVCLSIDVFISNDRLLPWITRILIFMPWLDYLIKIMLGSIPHQKLSLFIIYLLEDEQELSLGMLIRLKRIYNFWLLNAIILSLLYIFIAIYIIFCGLTF